MPELDGVTIVAMTSFAALIVAWLVAPSASASVADEELTAAA